MTRSRTALTLLALSGAAGLAAAQSQINFTTSPTPAPPAPPAPGAFAQGIPGQSGNTVTITSNENGETYRVEIRGDVVSAYKNGQSIEASLLERHPDRVVIRHPDGREEKVFRLRSAPQPTLFGYRTDRDLDVEFFEEADAPPVMLGISLGQPSAALRYHLNLGDTPAILIDKLAEGISADKAGLKKFDVIVSIDGSDHADGGVLRDALADKNPGDELELVIARGSARIDIDVELDAYDGKALSIALGNDPVVIGQRFGATSPVPPAPPTRPFIWSDQREEVIEKLRRQLQGNRTIRRHLDQEQLEELQATLEESLRGLDFGIGIQDNGAWGTLEFGKDQTLVFPKRRVEILAERERELADQAEKKANRAAAEAAARQREMERQLEAMRAQLEELSRMLQESED